MRTFVQKPLEVKKAWVLVDAKDMVLGRLAAAVAIRLRGKHYATFTPHVDGGDCVVVVNAAHVHLTGRKREDKKFYWHTGWPGGIKEQTMRERLDGRFPERVVRKAVERMLPRGPLGRQVLTHLRVYAGEEHPHKAQNPTVLDIGGINPKNRKGRVPC
ncbi:MAG: 50S ribosomal protein L13 [Holosporales bacterium]|jgi:large subunit ribosomal protein L13|nr:50S ribosomal protein L13 [Holosporales bacterium]